MSSLVDTFKNFIINLLILAGVLLLIALCFIAVEFSFRSYGILKYGKNNFYVQWMKKAGSTGSYVSQDSSNSLGFQSREIAVQKKENTCRIFTVGGSTVYGWKSMQTSWPWLLENRLKKAFPGKTIEVVNAGIPGATSNEELRLVRAIQPLSPDLVIVYDGWNDIYYSHYCTDWWYARHADSKYESGIKGHMKDFSQWLEWNSYSILSLKKKVYQIRKQLKVIYKNNVRHQNTAPQDTLVSGTGREIESETTVHCQNAINYTPKATGPVEDHFSRIYRDNHLEMHRLLANKNISYVSILQPSLDHSVVMGSAPKDAEDTLRNSLKVFYEDWLNTSKQLYPKARAVHQELKEQGIYAADFTPFFEGERSAYFTDSVHLDEKAQDMVAAHIERILVNDWILQEACS
jgi:lysophospholipase L1-like esterase